MTARKDSPVPNGAKLSAERNLWFEAKALAELRRLPTDRWEKMAALWGALPSAWPSTRRRVLAACIELAAKRGDPLPVKVAEHVTRELAPSVPRASVHHDLDRAEDGLRELARHFARNPQATLSELASATGEKKTTVRLWKLRPDFQVYLNDERLLVALEQVRVEWRNLQMSNKGSEGFKDLGVAAADWLDQRDRTPPEEK